ncbi:MAG TPA: competence/damage-inducible protein A [Actinomycetota bacterium]|nr:competence/damage-inducible protein A [Actinomycetota bacterium]
MSETPIVRAEVIGVGTELLLGQIANTNARWISERLAGVGVDVLHHQAVGDNPGRIVQAIRLALSRSEVVIVTGGLGPTQDDITREAVASAFGLALIRHPEIEERLRARFERLGRRMPRSNLVQADVPQGARTIVPRLGSAPGLVVEAGGRRLYALPGVPAEMREMMEGTVLPELGRLVGGGAIVSRILRCTGIAESRVAEILDDLFRRSANPTVAYLAGGGEVKVRLTAKAPSAEKAEALLAPLVREAAERIGDFVFTTVDESLEEAVGRLVISSGRTLSCAESLTGGELGARITSVPGASAYFAGSAVCYTAQAKRTILGVSGATLEGPGMVSRPCAREMAVGARRLYGTDLALALTGAAGPEAHAGAEPGAVWVALEAEGVSHQRGLHAPGDRAMVRRWAEQAALDLVRRHLEGRPLPEADRVV